MSVIKEAVKFCLPLTQNRSEFLDGLLCIVYLVGEAL